MYYCIRALTVFLALFLTASAVFATGPTLVYPSNGAVKVNFPSEFIWQYYTGGLYTVFHQIQIDHDGSFLSPDLQETISVPDTTATVDPGDLDYGTLYFWRVRAYYFNGAAQVYSDWSDVRVFTTISAVPTLTAPVNNATEVDMPVTLDWEPIGGVLWYDLQIDDNFVFASVDVDVNVPAPASSFDAAGLLDDSTRYFWRVRSVRQQGIIMITSDWSSEWNFTTIKNTPTLVSPVDGAQDVCHPIEMVWTSVPGTNHYKFIVSDLTDGGAIGADVFFDTAYNVPEYWMEANHDYTWKIRAVFDSEDGPFSDEWSFSSARFAPGTPTLAGPANGAINTPTALTLSWSTAEGAYGYRVVAATNPMFLMPVIDYETKNNFYSASGLSLGQIYYWKAAAIDSCDVQGDWSDVRHFTTECPEPDRATLVSPLNNATGVNLPTDFQWNAVDGADLYQLRVDDQSSFDSPEIDIETSKLSYEVTGLDCNIKYYWEVRARNDCGWGLYSFYYNFTTGPLTPGQATLIYPEHEGVMDVYPFTFVWSDVDNAEQYQLWVSEDFDFSTLLIMQWCSDSCYDCPYAWAPRKYYWKVRAQNSCVTADWCSVDSFTIKNFVDVREVDGPDLPGTFVLSQNYPNPFNPRTTIEFEIPRAQTVNIEVYNILGKTVRVLVDQRLSPGRYRVTWDGTDGVGRAVASGMYFYRLKTEAYTETKKMILMK